MIGTPVNSKQSVSSQILKSAIFVPFDEITATKSLSFGLLTLKYVTSPSYNFSGEQFFWIIDRCLSILKCHTASKSSGSCSSVSKKWHVSIYFCKPELCSTFQCVSHPQVWGHKIIRHYLIDRRGKPIKSCLKTNFSASELQRYRFNRADEFYPLLYSHLPQKMSPSEEFCQGLVCGILIGLFILWLETETSPDRNNHQQEQRAKKRGPEENDDSWSLLEKVAL